MIKLHAMTRFRFGELPSCKTTRQNLSSVVYYATWFNAKFVTVVAVTVVVSKL